MGHKTYHVGTKALSEKLWNSRLLVSFLVNFLAPGIRIQIQKIKSMRIHVDPDPHHCFSTFLIIIQLPQIIKFSSKVLHS